MASRPGTLDLALKRKPEAFASRYSVGVDVVHPYVYLVALDAASQVPPEGGHARHAMEGRRTHGRRLPQTLATLSPTWPPVDCSTSGPGVTFTWAILICVFRYSSPALAGRCYSPQVYCVLAGLYLAWARQGRPGSGPGHAAVRPPPPPPPLARLPSAQRPSTRLPILAHPRGLRRLSPSHTALTTVNRLLVLACQHTLRSTPILYRPHTARPIPGYSEMR